MEPRLKTSKKWTALPKELLEQIKAVFHENFGKETKGGKLFTEGRVYPEELLFSIGFLPAKQLRQHNFEVSLPYNQKKDNVMKLIHIAVDAGASMFVQLFEEEDAVDQFPRTWQEVEFEGRKLYIQYTTDNTELDEEADRLLGTSKGKKLAEGDWDEDEDVTPEEIKSRLGLDDDDEAADPSEDMDASDDDGTRH
jgi:hypothetical protein